MKSNEEKRKEYRKIKEDIARIKANNKIKTKEIIDDDGIIYEKVDYHTYLKSQSKHRIIKTLNAQYFVEKELENEK